MFIQLRRPKKESGVVLLMTLMAVVVIVIMSVAIFSQSMNQTSTVQKEIEQIRAKQLMMGYFWNAYTNAYVSGGNLVNMTDSVKLYNKTYSVAGNWVGNIYNLSVSY
ncbi:MAG: hypothetical protein HQL15_07650 [Candidatus Omnitrophica bacterium]|nr:hypothetical protein [Candidatus Omnitrophota bacterium]